MLHGTTWRNVFSQVNSANSYSMHVHKIFSALRICVEGCVHGVSIIFQNHHPALENRRNSGRQKNADLNPT